MENNSTTGIDVDQEDTINDPRQVFDSERIEKGTATVSLESISYADPLKGFKELCATYSSFSPSHAVFDLPSRHRRLFLSYVVDWITLTCIMLLLTLWWASPPTFYFRLDDPEITYPKIDETVSATMIILIIVVGPILVVTIAQIWVRSFRDWHQSILACLTLFAATQVICTFMWTLIGGMRPNFLSTCKPDLSRSEPLYSVPGDTSIGRVYYSDHVCTCSKEDLMRAKHSFPSGHAAGIVAMGIFLSIYVSAKLKTFHDNRSHLWKFAFILFFMVISIWISFSRIRDGRHHFKDVIIGMIIGAIISPMVYRLNFCSLTGPDNHIPTRYTWTGRFFPFPFFDGIREKRMAKRARNSNSPLEKTDPSTTVPPVSSPPTHLSSTASTPHLPPTAVTPLSHPPQYYTPPASNFTPSPLTPHNLSPAHLEGSASK